MIKKTVYFFLFFAIPFSAYANAGIPMILLGVPFMLLNLIPIILIEYVYYRKRLDVAREKVAIHTVIANLITTIIGYPLSWVLHLAVQWTIRIDESMSIDNLLRVTQVVLFQTALLSPRESHLYWLLPVAGMVGLVPAFFVSYFFEKWYLKKTLDKPTNLISTVWKAHLLSYSFLALFLVGYLGYNMFMKFLK